ncbi:uncharacterized protein [Physcomitrium patens]|uniref:Uncharacterized protein n=1 Tax=Physcomitrium patens TaxID=3218 RepID=A0A2K1KD96_PHYPA|nr:uncharacterized protein LOC112284551 isoform X1 [Physcomitrium patens]PNR51754.1 hypothetical protein PHYPA_010942 [Physcomitrium patens]|eukprot:XP_024380203.1 uncharacterized protein LOC112284551 isoform X1 [Physcomitrella patens]
MIIVIQQQRWPVLVAVMLVPFVWMCPVHGAFTLFGCEKDAWPELLHTTVGDALSAINTAGIVKNVYVQPPSSGLPPANMGTPADIWVYTDGADIVYEIPKRGLWHPNRVAPGWPDLAGLDCVAGMNSIKQDYLGVTIVYGPKGFMHIQDFQKDRVWVDINPDGTIAAIPAIG